MRNGNISHLYSPRKRLENPSVLQKITERCLTGWSRSHATALPGVTCLSVTAPGVRYTAASANGLMTVSLIIPSGYSPLRPNFMSFYWMPQSSRPTSTVQVQKKGAPNEIGHSRGGASSKIHAAVDTYGYPVCLMLSEGQRSDINIAIPVLEPINIKRSSMLADRGYDSQNLIDYISMKMVGNQLSRPKEEPSLSVIVTGSCIKNAIW